MQVEILGVKINNINFDNTLQKIEAFVNSETQHHIVTVNPEFLVRANKDLEFLKILNNSSLSVPDGIGIIFASYFLNKKIKSRVSGVDLMIKTCEKAKEKGWQVLLYGAEAGIAGIVAKKLNLKYPGLKIRVLLENTDWNLSDITKPAIMFVALGSPKQEKWIAQNLNNYPIIKAAIGVGGSFDFISGKIRRAPKLLRKVGLEWFWRLLVQPWRIKRIYKAVLVFPYLVLKEKIKKI